MITRRTFFADPALLAGITGATGLASISPETSRADFSGNGQMMRSLTDFGAMGDYNPQSKSGSDDTRAIQTAVDWAYGGGKGPFRALLVPDGNFLCGPITTYPGTTLIGSGRQTSNFWCRPGTRGDWWSDRGNGAQKLMLSGMAWNANNERGLTSVCSFGIKGAPFGTEGILRGLWMRDAPAGIGLHVRANVGFFSEITLQNVMQGLVLYGNANQMQNIVAMQCFRGAAIHGAFVRGMHVEATLNNGIPLAMYGDCRVSDLMISNARGRSFDFLIEIDDSRYQEWSLAGVHLLGQGYNVRKGMLKVGSLIHGGRTPSAFSGNSFSAKKQFCQIGLAPDSR